MADPFYITTAIHYPNGKPHIGHAYEMIAADAIARFQRQAGRDVLFQTGTDEHGLKMAQAARARGLATRDFADEMSSHFHVMADRLNISYDRFIRTVDTDHYAASQAIWQAMSDKGDLYLDRYEGWYSVRDEAFYDEAELSAGEDGTKLSPQGTPVEWTAEETWFFRLSKYQQPLLDLYAANPDFIRPESRRNEVMRFVEGGLSDLSVSRTSFDWGVPVPGSPGHVMYVWVDALTNYLTGTGYPDRNGERSRFWPADLHLIGKDIVRFHTVYWPAFLMSADIPLPRSVFGHGFLLHRGEKMSKSVGNVVDPGELADAFGVDALRYFFLREVSFGQDGSYSAEAIVTRVNAELANSFGNLAQRTLSFIAKNLDGALPEAGRAEDMDGALIEEVVVACAGLRTAFDDLMLSQGIEAWMRGVYACNQYIDTAAPWALRKTDPERMHAVLRTLVRAIRMLAIAILPVVPVAAGKVLDQLGAEARDHAAIDDDGWYDAHAASGFRLAPPTPAFPRLEMPAEAAA
ncbi:methionine--tRNA ligase [Sphingomonas carotinifaciens]|uniref:Methionine--tRNA ligase n=1 Tax=Sphingomonas carotinifaciens TaxID=1166323 RepID=A0A1G7PA73_9SPHN|nr:methionine--tRNA ligase [Sphingomonas carotinifaciens]MBB4087368.1 methionyl-tRNA synthetase [Sphingomonas carotinifaciens]MWC44607.1 methionine--tRNA ligase [Sphingomonas carotinifaciens]SDF83202.1 methionyl-tRNA synthetase [Sphingomonas carotinifaciens]